MPHLQVEPPQDRGGIFLARAFALVDMNELAIDWRAHHPDEHGNPLLACISHASASELVRNTD